MNYKETNITRPNNEKVGEKRQLDTNQSVICHAPIRGGGGGCTADCM